ncbi:MAG: VOC family protein [Gammaproteobacteria bacterium]
MIPTLRGIDHVHVYVTDRDAAAEWYQSVLGFKPVEKFLIWATKEGPLTLADADGSIHLALFESDAGPDSNIAFGTSGEEFVAWKSHLEASGLTLRIADHALAWSMYFHDPDGNMHEITTCDHAYVTQHLG